MPDRAELAQAALQAASSLEPTDALYAAESMAILLEAVTHALLDVATAIREQRQPHLGSSWADPPG